MVYVTQMTETKITKYTADIKHCFKQTFLLWNEEWEQQKKKN